MHPWETAEGQVQVTSVGVWQAGLLGAIGMSAFGVIYLVAMLAGLSRLAGGLSGPGLAGGLLGLGVGAFIALLIFPITGFITGVVAALLYNATGAITGGLEITVRE